MRCHQLASQGLELMPGQCQPVCELRAERAGGVLVLSFWGLFYGFGF
jgi:hypothetical protein